MNFYDQVVRVGKGWVEHEFVIFIICRIATWNKVAKWVNILQDKNYIAAAVEGIFRPIFIAIQNVAS